MSDYDIEKVSPRPWKIKHTDDLYCMCMSVIVDSSYSKVLGNVDYYQEWPDKDIAKCVAITFHKVEPAVGVELDTADANTAHIIHCVNEHEALHARIKELDNADPG